MEEGEIIPLNQSHFILPQKLMYLHMRDQIGKVKDKMNAKLKFLKEKNLSKLT
jgi:hypothetical protein